MQLILSSFPPIMNDCTLSIVQEKQKKENSCILKSKRI
ncbi:hypothetical protein RUMGNA_01607 [Mediterraneibacter gnavus ATCC 29149]|uniref:Uncharacterized protein n=1 Tax=Mediterraneibacter gnavus (strain ATCC 29149 / DSM 114966 / JCM 6515 / VPI C7-9) TaxID=411470 RepID=A7B232_MEDG7|nr:hypothetical protein RUMGNA_01607 [Mediterraneibacter gnavus ATCC 29149]